MRDYNYTDTSCWLSVLNSIGGHFEKPLKCFVNHFIWQHKIIPLVLIETSDKEKEIKNNITFHISLSSCQYWFSRSHYFQRIVGSWHKADDIEEYHITDITSSQYSYSYQAQPFSPLIGDRDGCVDAAAEADVVERVDDLGEDEGVEHAVESDGPGQN